MGEVYRATDTKLGREVALKVLPAEFAREAERVERFRREAQAIAALSHPNIVTIHSVEESDGRHFLVMELVEGQTLDEHTGSQPVPVPRLLALVTPIAEALAAAHEKGIVHRDLKPGNVMVTGDAGVKVLDFGLAKQATAANDESALATLAADLTSPGTLVGTPAYMSPEQVRGEPADARSDLFSLGLIIHELASGRHPFRRKSPMETASALLSEPAPALLEVGITAPPLLAHLVGKLLAKQPKDRYQTALGLLSDLQALAGASPEASATAPDASRDQFSIAVLPFRNTSADPENDFLADGLAEDLINDLARIESIKVVARTSAFQFRGKDLDIREIGRKLGVRTILEGSVRAAGKRLRVTAQLINVEDGYHLWSDRFDREQADLFDIQDEITAAIGDRLRATLGGAGETAPAAVASAAATRPGPDRDAEAHTAFMKGRHRMMELTPVGMESARRYFDKALEIDPSHADTRAALSWLAINLAHFGGQEPQPLYEEARSQAERALKVSDAIADAHGGRGFVHMYADWNWAASEKAFLRGLELAPNSASLHLYYGCLLSVIGRHDEAVTVMYRAQSLDPLAGIVNGAVALALLGAGRYDEAVHEATRGIDGDPDYWLTYSHRGHGYYVLGNFEESAADYQAAWERSQDPWALGGWICALDQAGRSGEAARRLAQLQGMADSPFVRPVHWALLFLNRGELDEGFAWYEKSLDARDSLVPWIPESASLRGTPAAADPRFEAARERMGMPPRPMVTA